MREVKAKKEFKEIKQQQGWMVIRAREKPYDFIMIKYLGKKMCVQLVKVLEPKKRLFVIDNKVREYAHELIRIKEEHRINTIFALKFPNNVWRYYTPSEVLDLRKIRGW